MWQEILYVFFALLILQGSFGVCLPTERLENMDNKPHGGRSALNENEDEEEGYQVILKSPTQTLTVEVVDEVGNASIRDIEVPFDEELYEDGPTEYSAIKSRKSRWERRHAEETYRCHWRRLYELYLNKRKRLGSKKARYSKEKRKEIRDAFKTVCENPEDAITYLLNLDE